MYQKNQVYTPQINFKSAFILRRIAWALGQPMTKTLNKVISAFLQMLSHQSICSACRDKRCFICPLSEMESTVSESPLAYRNK